MEIINAHAHIYPTKIAEKATTAIGNFYDIKMQLDVGTSDILLQNEKLVSKFIVHSCATKKEQVHSINLFILSEIQKHKEFIGFMTLHQDMTYTEIYDEIIFCKNNGFKGIKLHPDFQKFFIDSEDAEKIYRAVLETECCFPILFHTGDNRYDFSKPFRLAKMCKKYEKINFIGAHFGGYRCWDDVYVYDGLKNIYFDTSSSLMFITQQKAEELIKHFGAERFFFGDDFPMWNFNDEFKRFNLLNLTSSEKEQILSLNIKNLLNI